MQREAEERQRNIEQLKKEDENAKLLKKQKKDELFKVIAKDKDAKREHLNNGSKMDQRTSDFGSHNVLSYVYEKKEHKSVQLRAKNEHRIKLIQSQFKTEDKLAAFEAKAMNPD